MRVEYEVPLVVEYIHQGINQAAREDKKIKAIYLDHDEWTIFTNWLFEQHTHLDTIVGGQFVYRGVQMRYDTGEGESDAA
jgi:hypothetical protein